MKKKKRLNPILSYNDIEVLQFLWRHRIATFLALKYIFYSKNSSLTTYHRLLKLQKGDYIRAEKIIGTNKRFFSLGSRGFEFLKQNYLPELKSKQHRPQSQIHDLLVVSALLGRWKETKPKNVTIVTEQELRTTDVEILPNELRKELKHVPDGLWIIQKENEQIVVALEVEPSAKTSERYENICSFYANHILFKYIIWIVRSKKHAIRILESSRKYGTPREGIHLFIELEDFKKKEWDSLFLNESLKDISFGNFLETLTEEQSFTHDKKDMKMIESKHENSVKYVNPNPFLQFTISLDKFDN
ncbi:MAG: hypothetical protein M9962_11090 [Oligoflexia bacterium]|nr:hypothetical protein [Oligoflexia bacterium]